MVRRPLSDAFAISLMVVFSTPLWIKSCRATSISFSLVLATIVINVLCKINEIFAIWQKFLNFAQQNNYKLIIII